MKHFFYGIVHNYVMCDHFAISEYASEERWLTVSVKTATTREILGVLPRKIFKLTLFDKISWHMSVKFVMPPWNRLKNRNTEKGKGLRPEKPPSGSATDASE